MRHKRIEKLIVVDFYGELPADSKRKLERHLVRCLPCGNFKKDLERMIQQPDHAEDSLIDVDLFQVRSELRRSLSGSSGETPGSQMYQRLLKSRQAAAVPVYTVAVIAFIMLAVGFGASYLFFYRTGNETASVIAELNSQNEAVAIDNIKFVSTNQTTGQVQFSFDFIKRYEIKGSLDDQGVQKILTYALINSDNPGLRLKSVGMLDAAVKPDWEIETALLKAAKSDDNAGVRREALLSLDKLPFDDGIRGALLFVLQNDKNPGMRVMAINYLSEKGIAASSSKTKTMDPNVMAVLKERSLTDRNRYVRLKATAMLKRIEEL